VEKDIVAGCLDWRAIFRNLLSGTAIHVLTPAMATQYSSGCRTRKKSGLGLVPIQTKPRIEYAIILKMMRVLQRITQLLLNQPKLAACAGEKKPASQTKQQKTGTQQYHSHGQYCCI